MNKLKAGDKVCCRIRDNRIVLAYADYDTERSFEIIASDTRGYYIYIPEYFNIYGTIHISPKDIKLLNIKNKFLDCTMMYIVSTMIVKIQSILDGCFCCKCNEFYNYAKPNQDDKTLICFACRKYPIYISTAHDED